MSAARERDCCAFCGLPLARPWWSRRGERRPDPEPRYCCYGCALAHATTASGTPTGDVRALLTRLGVGIFLTMNVMVFSMELWTQDVYADGAGMTNALAEPLRDVFRYLCLLLSLPVLWLLGRPIAAGAWQNLRRGGPTTDLLIVLGVAAATVYSAISVLRGTGHIYFEVGCVVLVMVTLGRWLDATGKLQTTAALDALEKLLPERVRLVRDGCTSFVPPEQVCTGDCLRVLAGERFSFDGRLLAGLADVDEQILTGESRPVAKRPGDVVHAGTLNLDGDLLLGVTAELREGTLQRMVDLVRKARLAKGYHARLADRVSSWFLPAVAVLAIATFTIHAAHRGFEQGLLAGLAVSLIACPCALGLATPMAVWAALGRASQEQVLVRSGEALERLAAVRVLALDKTGTLTTGIARVAGFVADVDSSDNSAIAPLAIAASLAEGSNHPLSIALDEFAREKGVQLRSATTNRSRAHTLPGLGIARDLPDGETAWLGNLRLMQENDLAISDHLRETVNAAERQARSLACVGWNGRVRGVFLFTEDVRRDAQNALDHCRRIGLQVCVLTGDHSARAAALAAELGVEVEAQLLPADKVAAVERLRHEWGAVAMVASSGLVIGNSLRLRGAAPRYDPDSSTSGEILDGHGDLADVRDEAPRGVVDAWVDAQVSASREQIA